MGWGGWGKCTQLKAGPRADAPTSMPRQFRLSVCRSVRRSVGPSVTRVYCIKTAEHIIKILSLSDRPSFYFFVTEGRCINLTASPSTGAPNTIGGEFPTNMRLYLVKGTR